MKRIAWIGNDVHQETITIRVYLGDEQEPQIEKTIKKEEFHNKFGIEIKTSLNPRRKKALTENLPNSFY